MVVIESGEAQTIIDGDDGRGYAERAEGGGVLLTVSCATNAHDRLIVDTELSRADAAQLLVQLIDAYGIDEAARDGLWYCTDDEALRTAMVEAGWGGKGEL